MAGEAGFAPRTTDELFARLAAQVPGGFGGLHKAGAGDYVVSLKDLGKSAEARNALLNRQGGWAPENRAVAPSEIRFVQAEYGWDELYAWYKQLGPVYGHEAVMFVDVDERRNRLHIGVDDAGAIDELRREIRTEGTPTEAVVIEDPGWRPITAATTLEDQVRPVQGGFIIRAEEPDSRMHSGGQHAEPSSTPPPSASNSTVPTPKGRGSEGSDTRRRSDHPVPAREHSPDLLPVSLDEGGHGSELLGGGKMTAQKPATRWHPLFSSGYAGLGCAAKMASFGLKGVDQAGENPGPGGGSSS